MTSLSVESPFCMNHRMNNFKRITKTGSILYSEGNFEFMVRCDKAKTIIVYSKMHTFKKCILFTLEAFSGSRTEF